MNEDESKWIQNDIEFKRMASTGEQIIYQMTQQIPEGVGLGNITSGTINFGKTGSVTYTAPLAGSGYDWNQPRRESADSVRESLKDLEYSIQDLFALLEKVSRCEPKTPNIVMVDLYREIVECARNLDSALGDLETNIHVGSTEATIAQLFLYFQSSKLASSIIASTQVDNPPPQT